MLNVVAVNWRNYCDRGVAYTNCLFDSVRRNLEAGTKGRFIVFVDELSEGYREGIEQRLLPAGLHGWYNKLYLFKEGLFPEGDRVLFFDLDTVITGSIDALAAYDGDFAILQDFYRPHGLQSSVMAWRAGDQTDIWRLYEAAGCPMDHPHGDQGIIEMHAFRGHVRRLQNLFPGMFVSYKQTKGIPTEASVVVFHGRPRPHEVTDGWVPKVWCEGGLSHAELTAVCNTALERLLDNVRSARQRDLPWFDAENQEHDGHVAIVGGGPSVVDMLDEIKWRKSVGQQIWVLNNAAKVLDGIEVDAQVLLDARVENVEFITPAKEYLVASQCDPIMFEALSGRNVTLWHVNTPGMAELLADEKARVTYLVGGGTTVGMNALALAFSRGFRKIHLYGFDSSYRGDQHHAYPQALNDLEGRSEVVYGERSYVCATWMVGQAQEFMEMAPAYAADGCTITVHGSGLLPDIAKDLATAMTPAQVRAWEITKRIPKKSVGVEIGVFAGDLSRELLRADDGLTLIMVDSWEGSGAAYQGDSGDWHAGLGQAAQNEFYAKTVKRIRFARDRAKIFRRRSLDAAKLVPDGSCDFVFIDADHSYDGCKADIEAWLPKVKPGGWLCGHDYQNHDFERFGVTRAVDEFVAQSALQLETGENFCWFVQIPSEQAAAA